MIFVNQEKTEDNPLSVQYNQTKDFNELHTLTASFRQVRFSFEQQSETIEKNYNLMTKMIYTKKHAMRISKLKQHDIFSQHSTADKK